MKTFFTLIIWYAAILAVAFWIAVGIVAMFPGSAKADPVPMQVEVRPAICFDLPPQEMARRANEYSGEVPAYQAIDPIGWMLIVLLNEETGSYSIFSVQPGGERTCMINAGEGWQAARPWLSELLGTGL